MPAQTSTVPVVLDTLKSLLEAQAGQPGSALAKVAILTAPSGDPDIPESVQFSGVVEDQVWAALGAQRVREEYPLSGMVLIVRRGAGEAKAKEVRDRAYAILAEIAVVLRANPTLGIGPRTDVRLATAQLEQGWSDNGRYAAIDFTIAVKAELTK